MKEYKEPYNVDELRDAYKKAHEYLNEVEKRDSFYVELDKNAKYFEKKLKIKTGLNKLVNDKNNLEKELEKFNKLFPTEEDHYDGIEQYDKFTDEQVVEYFELLKNYELLNRKILKEKKNIACDVSKFEEDVEKTNFDQIKELENSIIEKGLKLIDLKALESDNDKYSIEKIKEMLIENKYTEYHYPPSLYDNHDYSASKLYQNLYLNNWFGNMLSSDYKKHMYFQNERLLKDCPSTFEYFMEQLEKQTGKRYEKIDIVTNQTICFRGEYDDPFDNDSYEAYCATLLLPECVAEAFKKTEQKKTKTAIEDFVKNHNDVLLLNGEFIQYYSPTCRTGTEEEKKKSKFNDTYREKLRKELANSRESNQIPVEKAFGIKDLQYGLNEEKIINKLPSKEVANAIFETLEYSKKLVRLSELEKVVKHKKKQEDAEKEYEKLKNKM